MEKKKFKCKTINFDFSIMNQGILQFYPQITNRFESIDPSMDNRINAIMESDLKFSMVNSIIYHKVGFLYYY